MGRLFWKFFLAFWLTLALLGSILVTVVWLYHQTATGNHTVLQDNHRLPLALRSAQAVLRYGGPEALKAMLSEAPREHPLYVITPEGKELLGRPLPSLPEAPGEPPAFRESVSLEGQGRYELILPPRPPVADLGRALEAELRPPPKEHRPSPLEPIAFGLVLSLVMSALLAWYLSKPIRHLRGAFDAVAKGRLDTRVAPLMRRSDEIADLGRDFDRMTERLEQLVVAQRRLLHDVSHELRSPLARLQVAIGIARQDPSKMALTLDRLERESARLDTLVGEILTLSRLESGTGQQALVTDDLADLIAEVASDADFEAKARGLAVTFSGPQACPLACHPDLLQRAIENLVRNSLKFTAPGTTVEIVLAVAGAQAVITVADRGPGVPEEELEHIFQPFIRGRNQSRDGEEAGFGLGLAIARHAVEAHGGTLAARNREGGGLLMEIKLPLGPQVA